jgi:hypothetical protein
MNRVTKVILGISLNGICAIVGLGLAGTANAGGVDCTSPQYVVCDAGCGAWYEGPAFQCCSTWGTSCCARTCHVYECLLGHYAGPCNTALQNVDTPGAELTNEICYLGNYCQNNAN